MWGKILILVSRLKTPSWQAYKANTIEAKGENLNTSEQSRNRCTKALLQAVARYIETCTCKSVYGPSTKTPQHSFCSHKAHYRSRNGRKSSRQNQLFVQITKICKDHDVTCRCVLTGTFYRNFTRLHLCRQESWSVRRPPLGSVEEGVEPSEGNSCIYDREGCVRAVRCSAACTARARPGPSWIFVILIISSATD